MLIAELNFRLLNQKSNLKKNNYFKINYLQRFTTKLAININFELFNNYLQLIFKIELELISSDTFL